MYLYNASSLGYNHLKEWRIDLPASTTQLTNNSLLLKQVKLNDQNIRLPLFRLFNLIVSMLVPVEVVS
jgi:hypothetical protein